ncbi:MAG: HPr family phosphocarrier protein [Lachnospiraceae bacterium]
MNKIKIKLLTPEMVCDFINVCTKYEDCDINVYDKSNVIDGKSIVGVFAIAQGKEIEVQAKTEDKSILSKFVDDMRKFEV